MVSETLEWISVRQTIKWEAFCIVRLTHCLAPSGASNTRSNACGGQPRLRVDYRQFFGSWFSDVNGIKKETVHLDVEAPYINVHVLLHVRSNGDSPVSLAMTHTRWYQGQSGRVTHRQVLKSESKTPTFGATNWQRKRETQERGRPRQTATRTNSPHLRSRSHGCWYDVLWNSHFEPICFFCLVLGVCVSALTGGPLSAPRKDGKAYSDCPVSWRWHTDKVKVAVRARDTYSGWSSVSVGCEPGPSTRAQTKTARPRPFVNVRRPPRDKTGLQCGVAFGTTRKTTSC